MPDIFDQIESEPVSAQPPETKSDIFDEVAAQPESVRASRLPTGPPVKEPTPDYLGKDSLLDSTNFGRAFLKSMYGTASGLENTARAGLKLFGGQSDTLDAATRLTEDQLKSIKVDNDSVGDIHSVGDLGNYVTAKIGELAPMLAMAYVGGAAGGSSKIGKFIGTSAPFIATGIGEEYQGIKNDTGIEAPGTAIATGTAKGLLMSLPVGHWLGSIFSAGEPELKQFVWKTVIGDTLRSLPKAALEHGASFGAISGVGEVLHQVADKVADSNYDLLTKDNWQKVLHATVEGAATGALLGITGKPVETYNQHLAGDAQFKSAQERAADIAVKAAQDFALKGAPNAPTVASVPKITEAVPSDVTKELPNELPEKPKESTTSFNGLKLTVEYPAGSIRSGEDASGNKWKVKMPADYGRIQRAEGGDGEPFDFYLGPDKQSDHVYLIDQKNPDTGKHDEQKALLGFSSPEAATAAYDAAFSDGSGPSRRAAVTAMTMDNFKNWLKTGDQTKPFAPEVSKVSEVPTEFLVPPTKAEDIARYQEIQTQMKGLAVDDPRFTQLWQENEQIKNRHGAMPPIAEEAQPTLTPDQAIEKAQQELVQEKPLAALKHQETDTSKIVQTPTPESFESVDDLLKFRRQRINEELALYQEQIGINAEQAKRLHSILVSERSTDKFEASLTPEQRSKMDHFFERSKFNQKDGPFQTWGSDRNFNPEQVALEEDKSMLASTIVRAADRGIELSPTDDRFLSAAIAARRLKEMGGTQSDLAKALDKWTTANSQSQGDKVEYFKSLGKKIVDFTQSQGIEFPQGELQRNLAPGSGSETKALPPSFVDPKATADALLKSLSFDTSTLAARGEEVKGSRAGVKVKRPAFYDTFPGIDDPTVYSPELGQLLSDDARSDKAQADVGVMKGTKKTAGNNDNKNLTHRVVFLENQDTQEVIGVGISRNRGVYVGILPGEKSGMTLEQAMADGWVPIASARTEKPFLRTDPKATVRFEDAAQFEELVGRPAKDRLNSARATAEAASNQMQATAGAGHEIAAEGEAHGETSEDVSPEMATETEANREEQFIELLKEHLPRDKKGNLERNLTPDHFREAILAGLENPEDVPAIQAALLPMVKYVLESENASAFKLKTKAQQLGLLIEAAAENLHDQHQLSQRGTAGAQKSVAAVSGQGVAANPGRGAISAGAVPPNAEAGQGSKPIATGPGGNREATAEVQQAQELVNASAQRSAEFLKQAGIPGVRVVDQLSSGTNRPLAVNYLAIPDENGGVLISSAALVERLKDFQGDQAAIGKFLDAVIAEEAIHAVGERVLSQPEVEQVWSSLSDRQRARVIETYFGEKLPESDTGLTPYQLGHEFIRQFLQDKMFGTITEKTQPAVAKSIFGKISDVARAALDKVLTAFRRITGGMALADDAIRRVEEEINAPIKSERVGDVSGEAPGALAQTPKEVEQTLQNKDELDPEQQRLVAASAQVQNAWVNEPRIKSFLDSLPAPVADKLRDIFGERVAAYDTGVKEGGNQDRPVKEILNDDSIPMESRLTILGDRFSNVWSAERELQSRKLRAQTKIDQLTAAVNKMSNEKIDLVDDRAILRKAVSSAVSDYVNSLASKMQAEGNLNKAEAYAYALKQVETIKKSTTGLERLYEAMAADPHVGALLESNPKTSAQDLALQFSLTHPDLATSLGVSFDMAQEASAILLADRDLGAKILALNLTNNPATRADIDSLIQQMRTMAGKGVVGDLKEMLKEYGSLRGKQAVVQAALDKINPKLNRSRKSMATWKQTLSAIDQFGTNPGWRDVRSEIYDVFNAQSAEKTYEGDKIKLVNPLTGEKVEVNTSLDRAGAQENLAKLKALFDDANVYIADKDAPGYDPKRAAMWQYQINNVEGFWLNPQSNPLVPHATPAAFDIPDWLKDPLKILQTLGGPREINEITAKMTAKAHGEKMLRALEEGPAGRKVDNANRQAAYAAKLSLEDWYAQVSNEIAGHAQYVGQVPLKVGDITKSGHKITELDMAAMRAQKEYTNAQRQIAENGKGIASMAFEPARIRIEGGFRSSKPTSLSELTLPSSISARGREWFRQWSDLKDPIAKLDWLNKEENFQNIVMGHMDEASTPGYRVATPFRKDYARMVNDFRSGIGPESVMEAAKILFDKQDFSDPAKVQTESQFAGKIIDEIDRAMQNFGKKLVDTQERTKPGAQVSVFSGDNSYTKPRDEAPAFPHTFLDYGVMEKGDRVRLAIDAMKPYQVELTGTGGAFERAAAVMDKGLKNMEQQLRDSKLSDAEFQKSTEAARKRGEMFYDYAELKLAKKRLDLIIKNEKAPPSPSSPGAASFLRRMKDYVGTSVLVSPTARITHTGGNMMTWGEFNKRLDNSLLVPVVKHVYNLAKTVLTDVTNQLVRFKSIESLEKVVAAHGNDLIGTMAETLVARRREIERMRELGLVGDSSIAEEFKAWSQDWRDMFKSYGKDSFGTRTARTVVHGVDLLSSLVRSQPFHSRYNDMMLNSNVRPVRLDMVNRLKQNAIKYLGVRQELGSPDYLDFTKRKNELSPEEITGNKGASTNQAEAWRELFRREGMSLDHLMARYHLEYEKVKAAGGDVSQIDFLTPGETASLDFSILQDTGLTTPMTRNYIGRKGLLGSTLNFIHGLPTWSLGKITSIFNRMSEQSTPQHLLSTVPVFLGVAAYALALGLSRQVLNKSVAKALYNQSSSLPTIANAQTPGDYAKVMTRALASWVPILGDIVNGVVLNTPDRFGNLDSQFIMWNAFTDLLKTAGAIIKTGDVVDPTMALMRRWVPTAKIITNRLESQEGTVQYYNAVADIRSAIPDSMEAKSRQAGNQYEPTAMTPLIKNMVNAAYRNDQPGFVAAYQAAIAQKVKDLDKTHPGANNMAAAESAVKSAFSARNPWLMNLRTLPTQEERELIISRMDPDQKAEVQKGELAFEQFAQLIGGNTRMTSEPSSGGSAFAGSRSSSSSGSSYSGGGGSSGGSGASAPASSRIRGSRSRRPRLARVRTASRLRRPSNRSARPRLARVRA